MNIASIIRHWFTLFATLLTGWLVLPVEQQQELHKALGDIVAPLAVILTLIVTALWRMALAWLPKIFRMRSGELEKRGPSGGTGLLLIFTAAAFGGALPSCAPSFPISACVETPQGTVCYSSKGGLTAHIDATK